MVSPEQNTDLKSCFDVFTYLRTHELAEFYTTKCFTEEEADAFMNLHNIDQKFKDALCVATGWNPFLLSKFAGTKVEDQSISRMNIMYLEVERLVNYLASDSKSFLDNFTTCDKWLVCAAQSLPITVSENTSTYQERMSRLRRLMRSW